MRHRKRVDDDLSIDDLYDMVATEAITEVVAQLKIMKLLSKLPEQSARRVIQAAQALCQADSLVPGTIDAFLAGRTMQ